MTTDPFERAVLLERAGDEATGAGHYDRAEGLLREALELRRAAGNRIAIAGAIASLGATLAGIYRTEAALELLEPALVEFADLAGESPFIAIGSQLARAYMLGYQNARAIEVADPVLAAAEHADLVPIIADTLVTKGTALGALGRGYEAIGVINAGRTLAEANGLSSIVLRAVLNGSTHEGDLRAALASLRAGLALARRLGRHRQVALIIGNATEPALRLGDWDWALDEADALLADEFESVDRALVQGARFQLRRCRGLPTDQDLAELEAVLAQSTEPNSISNVLDTHAWDAWVAGRYQDAFHDFTRLAELDPSNAPYGYSLAGRAALWNRRLNDAIASLDGLNETGAHRSSLEAGRRTLEAGIAALDGRPDDAVPLYREALRAWRELGLVW
ncbi:MAG: hypothetical protein ACRDGQ_14660, partial [Candidatus Limnocylindrales bacterium]